MLTQPSVMMFHSVTIKYLHAKLMHKQTQANTHGSSSHKDVHNLRHCGQHGISFCPGTFQWFLHLKCRTGQTTDTSDKLNKPMRSGCEQTK